MLENVVQSFSQVIYIIIFDELRGRDYLPKADLKI